MNHITVGSNVGPKFGSSNCVTVINNHTCARVKSDTIKLSPLLDDDNLDVENICDSDTPDLDITTIRAIAVLRSDFDFSEDTITTDLIQTAINYITLQAITPGEQALGKFTRRKLKNMDTRDDWVAGEQKQLNQFYNL